MLLASVQEHKIKEISSQHLLEGMEFRLILLFPLVVMLSKY